MRIALIHALKHSIAPIEAAFASLWPAPHLMNILDDTLSQDVARDGCITLAMTERFLTLIHYAVGNGAAGVLFTCSAFGPCIDMCKKAYPDIPILKPNEAMIDDALADGGRIGLLATFAPTLDSMVPEFYAQNPDASLVSRLIEGGLAALDAGDGQLHDERAAATALALRAECNIFALAQFSLARAEESVAEATGKPVLTTPRSAVRRLRRQLG